MNIQNFTNLIILLTASSCFSNAPTRMSKTGNNTNKAVCSNLNAPQRYAPAIDISKLGSAQEMLQEAILADSGEIVKAAALAGANVNLEKDGKLPLVLAVLLKKNQAVCALLETGANPDVNYLGLNLVKHAVKLGNIKAATLLVKKGANFSGSMDLGTIFEFDSQNIVSYIFKRYGLTSETQELLQELFDHGFNLNNGNKSMLNSYWKAVKLSKETINFLIKNGSDINQTFLDDTQIWTPLLNAVYYANLDGARLLIEAGANVNQAGYPLWWGKQTPLSLAIKMGNYPMVELLLKYNAK